MSNGAQSVGLPPPLGVELKYALGIGNFRRRGRRNAADSRDAGKQCDVDHGAEDARIGGGRRPLDDLGQVEAERLLQFCLADTDDNEAAESEHRKAEDEEEQHDAIVEVEDGESKRRCGSPRKRNDQNGPAGQTCSLVRHVG